jgi:hypothetical protein
LTGRVEEVARLKVCDGARSQARVSLFLLRQVLEHARDQFYQLSKFLAVAVRRISS